jgi:serine/threonine-protein kinase
VYGRNGSLFAATFNAGTLQVGPPAPILEGVLGIAGLAAFGFSPAGALAYVSGGTMSNGNLSTLIWADRQGTEQALMAPPHVYNNPRISPDGARVAVQIFDLSQTIDFQIWVHDLARGTNNRLTFERVNGSPVWTSDGKRLIYTSGTIGNPNATLAAVAADGSGPPVILMGEGVAPIPTSVSADGKLAIGVRSSTINTQADAKPAGNEVWVLPLDGAEKEAKPQPFLDTRFIRGYFQFSPDGKSVAYESNETGRNEVFVVPYPGPGGKTQVSTEGGTQPHWNRNGRELFFRSGDKLMAVDVETGAAFRALVPRVLFTKASPDYDVAPDGRRFLMLKAAAAPEGSPSELHVVLNWFDELRRRVPLPK